MRMPPRKPVNERSIISLKKRALRRTKTLRHNSRTMSMTESLTPPKPSLITKWKLKLKTPFTRVFWEDVFEHSDDENLVDSKLLSYAYLEAGVIEMLGS